MVTHNRPGYARAALERLLSTCDDRMRVWVWHNGTHAKTLELVRTYVDHVAATAIKVGEWEH